MDKEIAIINKIVLEAVKHGSDAGGSYNTNEIGLVYMLETWLEYHKLLGKYIIDINARVVDENRTV